MTLDAVLGEVFGVSLRGRNVDGRADRDNAWSISELEDILCMEPVNKIPTTTGGIYELRESAQFSVIGSL
jgi:hypothetical protein